MPYRYCLDCEVAEAILRLPSRHREDLIRAFQFLALNPLEKGEASFRDSSLREIRKKHFGRWIVSYWPDHPVQEMRIVGIQPVFK